MKEFIRELAKTSRPRYTSYPTAPQFSDEVDAECWRGWLAKTDPNAPVSLYLHVPFCREVCWYCACNMKLGRDEAVLEDYTLALMDEIALLYRALGGARQVGQIHWGGGTPTAIGTARMAQIMDALRIFFDVLPDAEIAVELDPRTFDLSMAGALSKMGVTRASLGVQTFDAKVQATINRKQPFDRVNKVVCALRLAGVRSLNFDMMYGLPHQDAEVLDCDLQSALLLSPDRIALFGYAHVPWVAKRQRQIDEAALPDIDARVAAASTAHRHITKAGLIPVGLDHFARPEDSMAIAAKEGRLRRNFQGYTVDGSETLLGLGASSISALRQGYAQNATDTRGWARSIRDKELPIARGLELTSEDKLRRGVIEDIMCRMEVDLWAHLDRYERARTHFDAALGTLEKLQTKGVVTVQDGVLKIAEDARPALRVVASAFDAYPSAKMQYSKAV